MVEEPIGDEDVCGDDVMVRVALNEKLNDKGFLQSFEFFRQLKMTTLRLLIDNTMSLNCSDLLDLKPSRSHSCSSRTSNAIPVKLLESRNQNFFLRPWVTCYTTHALFLRPSFCPTAESKQHMRMREGNSVEGLFSGRRIGK